MMLSELKNDGLIDLALLTRIYDVHEIHTLEYQSIGALAEHFVHEESIIYEQAFDSLDYSCLVSIFFCKLYQLLNLIILLFFILLAFGGQHFNLLSLKIYYNIILELKLYILRNQ